MKKLFEYALKYALTDGLIFVVALDSPIVEFRWFMLGVFSLDVSVSYMQLQGMLPQKLGKKGQYTEARQ